MKTVINENEIRPLIILALKEDIGDGDVTTNAIFNNGNSSSEAVVIANEDGIFCGGEIVKIIFREIDPTVQVNIQKKDGKQITKGDKVLKIKGHTKSLLTGERTCMNFIQRMSGIASKTNKMNNIIKKTGISLLDTRKTVPGLRLLDKYAVKCGGGKNHRFGLYDMVMIKDNHIKAGEGITETVNKIRSAYGNKYKIEVEVKTLDEVKEAVECSPDFIMFDNMNKETMKTAISMMDGKIKTEISGNMSEERLAEIADLKIDFVSVGALTHSVKAFDFSMLII